MKWSVLAIVLLSIAGTAFIAASALLSLKELGPGNNEQLFYKSVSSRSQFFLGEVFPSERQCVLPGGGLPQGWALQHFPQAKVSNERMYDSQDDWFIILLTDNSKNVAIIPISYEQSNLKNEQPICSANILIAIDKGQAIHASE